MSGMTAAIALARKGHGVTVLEANSRLGKKISLTGNGRCNIMNESAALDKYNKSAVAEKIVPHYLQKVKDFFAGIGLVLSPPDSEGRIYPLTNNANSVVDCMRFALEKSGAKSVLDCEVHKIGVKGGKPFAASSKGEFYADAVILASGSSAGVKPHAAPLDEKFFTPRFPSLTPVKVADPLPVLNGVHLSARVSLHCEGEKIFSESGEVLFKEYGLSGIVVLNMSAVIARGKVAGINDGYVISLDMFESMSVAGLAKLLETRFEKFGDTFTAGLMHNKIAQAAQQRLGRPLTKKALPAFAALVKNFTFRFDSLVDRSMAQVIAGGVDEKFLDERHRLQGAEIYCVGEALNVDGMCGGHNLYFAAASALFAAENF